MVENLINIYDQFSKNGRLQDLAQLAKEQGNKYRKREPFGNQFTELKGFKLFSAKGSKRLLGIIEKRLPESNANLRFYDFTKTKDLDTKSVSVVEVKMEEYFFDQFTISPNSGLNLVKSFFSSKTKIHPQLKTFHKHFKIDCSDANALLILNKSTLGLLENFHGINIEAKGKYIIFYYPQKELALEKVLGMMNLAEDFLATLLFDNSEDYV